MLTYLRYALAIACFAASLGCLWWRHSSVDGRDYRAGPVNVGRYWLNGESARGTLMITAKPLGSIIYSYGAGFRRIPPKLMAIALFRLMPFEQAIERSGQFGVQTRALHFPLWYPALLFAIAGIAVLRLGRRFTLRAAIIATSVVAVLLAFPATL